MVGLLDVNVLVALFDPTHIHHEPAHDWFGRNRSVGWATCPITENGLVRILSNPKYAGCQTTVNDAVDRLRDLCEAEEHTFWPDTPSVRDAGAFPPEGLGSHRKLTDLYLLALATENDGRLVTFDRSISLAAVGRAESRNLEVIG